MADSVLITDEETLTLINCKDMFGIIIVSRVYSKWKNMNDCKHCILDINNYRDKVKNVESRNTVFIQIQNEVFPPTGLGKKAICLIIA